MYVSSRRGLGLADPSQFGTREAPTIDDLWALPLSHPSGASTQAVAALAPGVRLDTFQPASSPRQSVGDWIQANALMLGLGIGGAALFVGLARR